MSVGLKGNADGSGAIQVGGTDAVTLSTALDTTLAGSLNAPNTFAFKNRIINGAMVIDQRNAGASVTPTASAYTLDRWYFGTTQASKLSFAQSSTSTTGFTNSLLATSLSAYSVVTGDTFTISQRLEGFNTFDLGWGTASASTVTLSFWVRSSLTGTFGGAISNYAFNRSYPFTYTISSANTWEQKTINIPGDTSGTWVGATNAGWGSLTFGLGVGATYSGTAGTWAAAGYTSATGATSVVGTNGATFYITGVQLEKGRLATSFDYRPYGTELSLCQRYLPAFTTDTATAIVGSGGFASTTRCAVTYTFPVTPRTSPTGVTVSAATDFFVSDNVLGAVCTSVTFNGGGQSCAQLYFNTATVYAAYRAGIAYTASTSAKLLFTGCEL